MDTACSVCQTIHENPETPSCPPQFDRIYAQDASSLMVEAKDLQFFACSECGARWQYVAGPFGARWHRLPPGADTP